MKRSHKAATSKSASPSGVKSKRTKLNASAVAHKIKKWSKAASTSQMPSATQSFSNKLWKHVDKSDPKAVELVLQQHLLGKQGDPDSLYFSSSRYWHAYKILGNEELTYFYLSLWSVMLEAKSIAGDSCFVGDQNCAIMFDSFHSFVFNCHNSSSVFTVLNNLDSVSLAYWYEKYYLLRFGVIHLTDNTEMARNLPPTYVDGGELELPIAIFPAEQIELQQPNDEERDPEDPEETVRELYYQFDRYRPSFLYVDKIALEALTPEDRTIVVLNVLSDVDYQLPEGWSYTPPRSISSLCVPLDPFNGLGVQEQIELANEMLILDVDYRPLVSERSTNTDVEDYTVEQASQTLYTGDNLINLDRESYSIIGDLVDRHISTVVVEHMRDMLYHSLQSPELNFDDNFQIRTPQLNHVCQCIRCNVFLMDFLNQAFIDVFQQGWDNFYRSNCDVQCSAHMHAHAETRSSRANVDLDSPAQMSRSSPDILSTDSSSSSSTSSDSTQQSKPSSSHLGGTSSDPPVVIISDKGIPTNVERASTSGPSQDIIILDDTGTVPIVRLATSPRRPSITDPDPNGEKFFTPPQQEYHTDQITFNKLDIPMERIYLDLLISSTTWGEAHDVMEATRWGKVDIIPTEHVAAAVLRILPIIATRASGGELQAVNAVGLIKGRMDEFLNPTKINIQQPSSTASTIGSISSSAATSKTSGATSRKRKRSRSRSQSPPPIATPDTPSYHPSEGYLAYDRASRYLSTLNRYNPRHHQGDPFNRGSRPTRALPRMSGPLTQVGGWYQPPPSAPPYVAAHRAIPGWVPGMPRPPTPWDVQPTRRARRDSARPTTTQPTQPLPPPLMGTSEQDLGGEYNTEFSRDARQELTARRQYGQYTGAKPFRYGRRHG